MGAEFGIDAAGGEGARALRALVENFIYPRIHAVCCDMHFPCRPLWTYICLCV